MADSAPHGGPGIARRLAATLLSVAHTRLALAGLELEEEIERLVRLLVTALAIVVFGTLSLLTFSFLIVIAAPDGTRLEALGFLVLFYALAACACAFRLWRSLKTRPPMFAATLAEFELDRASLREPARGAGGETDQA